MAQGGAALTLHQPFKAASASPAARSPDFSAPEGRLHFAGEHTSRWTGWMQGALKSGERAASEALAALNG